jgi:TRAP-type C4-dicarboxylate transport system permease small subunit
MPIRRLLEALYSACAALAAVCMVGLLGMVLLSILSRELGFHVRGTDAYAGYLMAGCAFLALAHTLKRGEHIRVTLLLQAASPRLKRGLEVWSLTAGALLASLLAFYSVRLAWQSHLFHDISTGNDATPLWMPQLAMALGSVVFAVAMVDEWILGLQGRRTSTGGGELSRNE